ncbi:S-adenosyl-L-methionine-dependent methyltransferase [Hesseltinella vesiculosa]|uniref:sphingolipid C(9)-methyltransferase n=1 Tax=Hesseltinella vesiculosa TaxID=101127 RepID=A0A1X2G470_9FUNG|nr:S-adenosyl-L-methionine-dependent methyltransferase [Hesseltinella vesiculosa]
MGQETIHTPTTWAAIKNPPYPAEGASNQNFNNYIMWGVLAGVPGYLTYKLGLPWWFFFILFLVCVFPLLATCLFLYSKFAPRYRNYVKLPEKPLEEYMVIHDPALKQQYNGRNKIPMETFFEAYFEGKIDIKGDILDMFEVRHDWAAFQFTMGQAKFFVTQWLPETFWHSREQDTEQVRDHYDRGDDFHEAFLGPYMVYTSGIISDKNKRETLEELQENKMNLICEKMHMKAGEEHLDIGCGWGTLVGHAAKNFGTKSTGVSLSRNQVAYGNKKFEADGNKNAQLNCMDYRDIPSKKYNKITCVEMAEHVGVKRFNAFLTEVRELMEDDGLFYMQVAGLRASWQCEDFIWGLFMARYIFPGADASTPLWWYTYQLENAGFEVQNVDTVGVHYSATLERWYLNWMKNRDSLRAKYPDRLIRIWDIFLAWSTIISRQGSATCYQIVAAKNRNGFDRAALIDNRTNPASWNKQA